MIKSLVKQTSWYYQIMFGLFFIIIVYSMVVFWTNNKNKENEKKEITEISILVKELEKTYLKQEINKFLHEGQNKEAIEFVAGFEKKADFINKHFETASYDQYKKNLGSIKNQIHAYTKHPKASEVSRVLHKKISSFSDYVKKNNWQRLSRISTNLLQLVEPFIDSQKINPNEIKSIKKFIGEMAEIVNSSNLVKVEKDSINEKLDQLNTEIRLLETEQSDGIVIDEKINFLVQSHKEWLAQVAPLISENLLQGEKSVQNFLYLQMAILLLVLAAILMGNYLQKTWLESSQRVLEANVLDIFENLTKNKNLEKGSDFSDVFYYSMEKHANYMQKRMNFGLLFQESIPFASAMIDQNLKIIWANHQFAQTWGISDEKFSSNFLSWDQLKKQTDLNDSTPIIDALKNNISGIFHVKVRNVVTSQSQPYEFYVNPVRTGKETHIMLYLYPLSQIQDSIDIQAKSQVEPFIKLLNSIDSNNEGLINISELKDDFTRANLANEFKLIKDLRDKFNSKIEILESNLAKNESLVIEQNEKIENYINQINIWNDFSEQITTNFKLLKEKIIHYISNTENLKKLNSEINEKCIIQENDLRHTVKMNLDINEANKDLLEVNRGILNLRTQIKENRPVLEELVLRIKNNEKDEEKIKSLKEHYFNHAKFISELDIKLTKLDSLLERSKTVNLTETSQTDFVTLAEQVDLIFNNLSGAEEEVVSILKKAFDGFKATKNTIAKNNLNNKEAIHSNQNENSNSLMN